MKIETKAIHSGYTPDPTTKSVATPIYQTTSYAFDSAQHGADLFSLAEEGNIYSRIMNPTNAVLEERLAQMEGGIASLAVSSGMSAITYAVQCLTSTGQNIVSVSELYGGTSDYFSNTLKNQGIEVRYANHDDIDGLSNLVDENTTLIFCESIGNPLGNICDIESLAKAAHSKGVPLVVDNTVATPYLLRPIDYGADIVVHSLTKYISGHGTTIGGAIIDGGNFDWSKEPKRFPTLNEPDNSYHGLIYSEALGAAAFIGRCRVGPLRNTGAALSPFNAFLILQGIQSLHVRMDRHCENTINVANYLSTHSQVKWVNYAGLENSPYFDLAKKYTDGSPSGILTFGIEGGKEAGIKFIDSLELIVRLVNIGDTKSLATHPASTTHSQLEPEEYEAAGISDDMIRISIGIENVDDIIGDIEQALSKSV
ncbi:MAG: O-acetylhomoserine aminocarboxypropyltransferase/cysteine synthase [Gammaproteobacteria bacterium]|jgi:O-acetylhomoserine (thiol)-lyase|nr:O-acetylhomoserine aminocarboxypropyltransferase/cysteine synthase [Gammaproteobacteria bacterium]MBT5216898.1 O-acetylhomoserine aminocarboxypropyltransferase/cysteine synthase [Gammaproteobacteria bacterium]MBT5542814.1 O-acetylhomoserine aminocarboxypropyltransferase/cysteine synthase [Gammaproteobacteria bacterium]MBT6073820.1 O-acetylhomoserine aminocarboxypropyltransferase/cysteine synthase [Gammaproteobacteria bacterium]MBT7753958.1 O-acetylhomoserine aminocarboxypropyltransferase/cys